jgi:hypothetical protein
MAGLADGRREHSQIATGRSSLARVSDPQSIENGRFLFAGFTPLTPGHHNPLPIAAPVGAKSP